MTASSTLRYACAGMALLLHATSRKKKTQPTRLGKPTRKRNRRSVLEVYNQLGDYYFRRAYRMTYASFEKLHTRLRPYILFVIRRKRQKTTQSKTGRGGNPHPTAINGKIDSSVRLAIALRYFAGGAMYDIAPLYGVGFTDCMYSVWYLVEAINACPSMVIEYPSDHGKQLEIAAEFRSKSTAGFDNCAGAVDGILIWTHRPYEKDAKAADCDAAKFFCSRKHKFGLNCQAVSDANGKILDISINYPGSTSDLPAFEASSLYSKCEKDSNFLADNLCIFGDNAYVNTPFLATPYPGVSCGNEDAYNFFHSQLRIRVECCFGVLVQRWGILRSAIPRGVTIGKSIRLVVALSKLHNFCLDEREELLAAYNPDEMHMRANPNGTVRMDSVVTDVSGTREVVPNQLLGGGHHSDGNTSSRQIARIDAAARQMPARATQPLPREVMLSKVINSGLRRPVPIPRRH